MNINILSKINETIKDDEIKVLVESSNENNEIQEFIKYIKNYNYNKKIVVSKDFEILEIPYKDIILFYSHLKNNYCKTKDGEYRIKSKLYEIEKMDINFIRISKSCIINLNHVKNFYIGETGRIVVRLDDKSEKSVSRRKLRDVMNYLDERSI